MSLVTKSHHSELLKLYVKWEASWSSQDEQNPKLCPQVFAANTQLVLLLDSGLHFTIIFVLLG